MPNNNNEEERTLDLPGDTSLPFFAYGIFKPGQIAHSKIRDYVDTVDNVEINYEMKHRDGVPILIGSECDYCHTNGFVIRFKEGRERKAYNIIRKTILRKLYEWKTIRIGEDDVNILFGVDPDNGSDYIENPDERVNFDGKKDPLFDEAIELIGSNLDSCKGCHMESFFELQMNYMLLWSAIERFSSIKYNKRKKKWNNERFSKEKAFKEGIKRYEDRYHRKVYSTDDLEMHEFNVDDPYETLKYYYTLRCNVVHRGKAMFNDYDLLKTATEELLELFRDVLRDTFDES